MAHLVRSIEGTNREPIYGPWRNCEHCRNHDLGETKLLEKALAETPQILGMSLWEFWRKFSQVKLGAET